MKTKICTKCLKEKPLDEFHKRWDAKDGRTPQCKECRRELTKKWRENNRERSKETARRWRERNPVKAKQYREKYYADFGEECYTNLKRDALLWREHIKREQQAPIPDGSIKGSALKELEEAEKKYGEMLIN